MFDIVSQDLIKRWVFPITPEMNPFFKSASLFYTLTGKNNVYLGQNFTIDRSSEIQSNTIIGHGCQIHQNSKIINSVLGTNVIIGSNCVIEGSYLLDNVRIEDNCKVFKSLIGDNCILRNHTQLQKGVIIGSNCVLGPDVNVPQFSRITSFTDSLEKSFDFMGISTIKDEYEGSVQDRIWKSQDVLGSEANCFFWDINSEEFSEYDAEYLDDSNNSNERSEATNLGSSYKTNFPSIFQKKYDDYNVELEDYDQESDDGFNSDEEYVCGRSPSDSIHLFPTVKADLKTSKSNELFASNVVDMVKNAIQSDYTIDNVALEINALKFACNSSFSDCRNAIIPALCLFIDSANVKQSCSNIFDKWSRLLEKFIHSLEDQIETIVAIQTCLGGTSKSKAFLHIIPDLYKMDILEDESIIAWYNTKDTAEYLSQVKPFIEWLQTTSDDEE